MSRFYTPEHRDLQDAFDTRRMADLMEGGIAHTDLTDVEAGFIRSVDMFFLATVDRQGSPTVSYKGGAPGFVGVADPRTLVFPSYDGNGMFFSMGNIAAHRRVQVADSKYVPKAGCDTPVPAWNRIDMVQDALPAKDQGKAGALGGTITMDGYGARLMSGVA